METVLGIVIAVILTVVLTLWLLAVWLYDRETLPPLGVIGEDLRFLRAILRINEVTDQAIAEMHRWAGHRQ